MRAATTIKNKMKPNIKFIFFWFLAIVVALLFEVFMTDFRPARWNNVIENCLFAFGMLLTVVFFDSKRIQRFLINCYFVFFVFCLFFESAFFYLFNTFLNPSSIYILLETNLAETKEFVGFYLDEVVLLYFLMLAVVVFFYLKMTKNELLKKYSRNTKFLSGGLLLCLLLFLKFSGLIVPNLPYLTGKSVWEYVQEQQRMATIDIDGPRGNFVEVRADTSSEKSLYVLVIGESTTRNHMGIYGYPRETTPKLNEIKKELLLYQNVVSSHTHTIESLRDALTLNGFQKEEESSIVQLMNRAGFKTFWLSNQRPLGTYDTFVTKIAQASEVLKFSNSASNGSVTNFDEILLPYLEEAFADPADKKFIVLHLLGTHVNYQYRYPESFDYFTKKPPSQFTDELASTTINQYDNGVRYNDTVIRKIIEKTREQATSSYVLYFSDHGEEVYQSRYFAGHTEVNATQNMFEVPFLLWRSEQFKKLHPIYEGNLTKPYVLDDFIYSLADLSQIYFAQMKEEKSIFSEKFVPKKRIVGKGIDFDRYFEP